MRLLRSFIFLRLLAFFASSPLAADPAFDAFAQKLADEWMRANPTARVSPKRSAILPRC